MDHPLRKSLIRDGAQSGIFQSSKTGSEASHNALRKCWRIGRPDVCMCDIYMRSAMPRAKLFNNGGSQAVQLPSEFRFDTEEVDIRRDAVTGDVVLSKPLVTWDNYFAWVAAL